MQTEKEIMKEQLPAISREELENMLLDLVFENIKLRSKIWIKSLRKNYWKNRLKKLFKD